jgi:predicted HAD superfamily phosphohydrolase YqeG
MKYKQLKYLQDYYLDTMSYDSTFVKFLAGLLDCDETLKKIGLSKHEIEQFIEDISSEKIEVNKNTRVKFVNREDYTIAIYALHPYQNYIKHTYTAKAYLRKHTTLWGDCVFTMIAGLLTQGSDNDNRVYVLIKE